MRYLITGGTGFVGRVLVRHLLNQGDSVAVLSRNQTTSLLGATLIPWKTKSDRSLREAVAKTDCVVNLAGEPLMNKRWSLWQKEQILQSRLKSTRALVEAMAKSGPQPKVFISASGIGYYGSRGGEEIDDTSSAGGGFVAQIAHRWEFEALKAYAKGVRVVMLRLGMVLGRGGALSLMTLPFKYFLGAPLGNGRQWISWIHVDDVARLVSWISANASLNGSVNTVSPQPVTMKEFSMTLAKVMNRPLWPHVPGFVLRAFLGERADLLLDGQRAYPKKITESGFKFKFFELKDALEKSLGSL